MLQSISSGVGFARSNGLWAENVLQPLDSVEVCGAESRDISRVDRPTAVE